MVVDPAMSVGSVKATGMSPLRVRAALTAVRSSVICAAFMTVVPGTSGLSLKPVVLVKVAVTARAALIVTVQVPRVALNAAGQAAFRLRSGLTLGRHTLKIVYSGDGNFLASKIAKVMRFTVGRQT